MKETSKTVHKSAKQRVMLTVLMVITAVMSLAFIVCYQALKAEAYVRYIGIKNVSAQNIATTIRGVEMNAKNVFEEVAQHLESPEEVIEALGSKADFNLDAKGYFAAFEPNYFPEKGTWYEPYVYQPDGRGFDYRQVGSARHNYMKSPWYVRAKNTRATFWSDPYYYYDGTSMSGHYSTYVKPIYDDQGKLICVCGADMRFDWMARELEWVDETSKKNNLLNKYHAFADFGHYTVLLDKDGTCIAHPQDKKLAISDKGVVRDLTDKRSGVADLEIEGVDCTIYYGPVDYVDWSLAIIVPKKDILMGMLPVGLMLLTVGVIGLLVVWLVLRRVKTEN